ncbi:LamG-like jellyroll fold domain-containing protein [Bacteroidota bacterium]
MKIIKYFLFATVFILYNSTFSQTTALWNFDEQKGIYPSSVISDHSDNDYPLVIGPGGMIVDGKYGNALDPVEQPFVQITEEDDEVRFGLTRLPISAGRTIEPMNWFNANFAALMTSGETHLRKQVGFAQPTKTKLNLGDFDWTVEFWFISTRQTNEEGIVFEIGQGPRGENNKVTKLSFSKDHNHFILLNQPSNNTIKIQTNLTWNNWHHLAFTYDAASNQLKHYVDGKLQSLPPAAELRSLEFGDEDYMSIGRNGTWGYPLQGKIDELRFSEYIVYKHDFTVPESFSYLQSADRKIDLIKGPELLFNSDEDRDVVLNLGSRKHLFIDDALLDEYDDAKFVVNPPKIAEIVMTNIVGSFRKHLNVLEDNEGKIRLYTTVDDDYLAVWISDDGINFKAPQLKNGKYKKHNNIVLHSSVGMGMVFEDPNAPKEERFKYVSDYHRRAVSIFYSEDGLEFKRFKQPVLPFRSGSQCNIFYDDQKQVYTAFHRSDYGRTIQGATQRDFVMTETKDLLTPWPFTPLTLEENYKRAEGKRVADLMPWYLDNSPLTPGGFALEYPWIFSPVDNYDPIETDIYVPKTMKYQWAPDTYLAFPIIYFHYEDSVPITRSILMDPKRKLGSGPLETQVAVSRNGTDWKRYPRPAYVGIGKHGGIDFKTAYTAHGMIKRGNEIWQYVFCEPHYHSPWIKYNDKRSVIRLVQRLDGFVSLDSPYEKEAYVITKPFTFDGNRLLLNIDTDAAGYTQVGFLDENDKPIDGFSLDDCIYVNGDFIAEEIEWMKNRDEIKRISSHDEEDHETLSSKVITSADVSTLQGRTVKLIFRMRGSKLYSIKFDAK